MRNSLFLFLVALCMMMFGCGRDLPSDYNFKCGAQIPAEQLAKYPANVTPQYSFDALKLLGKLSGIVFEENGRSKNYDVQFLNNDRSSLIIQVFGLADEAAIDKTACAVFGFQDYLFPDEVIILFYKNERKAPNAEIVVGLRKT